MVAKFQSKLIHLTPLALDANAKATEFERPYESVILAPLMGITPEQLDDVWLWATAV